MSGVCLSCAGSSSLLEPGRSMLLYWALVHLNGASVEALDTELGWKVFKLALDCNSEVMCLEGHIMSPQSVLADQVMIMLLPKIKIRKMCQFINIM